MNNKIKTRMISMNKTKKRSGLLVIILLLSITLAACGTVENKAQGTWKSTGKDQVTIKIDKDDIEFHYDNETIKGSVKKYNKDNAILELDGVNDNGKAVFKDNNMYIDDKKFKKVK